MSLPTCKMFRSHNPLYVKASSHPLSISTPKISKTKMSLGRIQSTDWLDDLENQISETTAPKQSEEQSCCIYAVPETLIYTNGKDVYRPRVVSIGPHHCSDDHVQVIKKHKVEFLKLLLLRKELGFNDLMGSIRPLAKEARECYSKEINLESFNDDDDRFLKMMVLDGCFLIELFLKAADKKSKDPLALIPRAVPYVFGDLLLLENQIPFFVLEKLFQTCKMREESDASLSLLALRFFNKVMRRPDGVIEKFLKRPTPNDRKLPLHLLDLVRSSLLVPSENKGNTPTACRLIHSISKLRRAGIKLKQRKAESFLDVKFKSGVIQMPNIIMNYNMKTFLLNCLHSSTCTTAAPSTSQFTLVSWTAL